MVFDLRSSRIYRAVLFYRVFPAGILKFWRVLLLILGLIPVLLAVFNLVHQTQLNISVGWTLVVFPFGFSALFFEFFAQYHLKYPKIKSTNNVADLIEFEAARIFDRAFELSRSLGEKELSVKILLSAMIEDRVMEKLFTRIMPTFNLYPARSMTIIALLRLNLNTLIFPQSTRPWQLNL